PTGPGRVRRDATDSPVPPSLNLAPPCSGMKKYRVTLADKLEIHPTPTHGSWLNMAEVELAVLSEQCLDRRIPDLERLATEIAAWEAERISHELIDGTAASRA